MKKTFVALFVMGLLACDSSDQPDARIATIATPDAMAASTPDAPPAAGPDAVPDAH